MNQAKRVLNFRRWTGRRLVCVFLVCASCLFGWAVWAEEQAGFFALTLENDSFGDPFGAHQDRHYTAGLKMAVFGGDEFATDLTARLNGVANWGIQPTAGDLGIVLGQNIYTPENIQNPTPVSTDRPYAGWLYTGFVYQRRGDITTNLAVMENFEINLGVVGPQSLAEGAQKQIHRWWFPDDLPRGWDHQLKTEPGLELKYARLWRYSPTPALSRYADIIPRVGFELGNVQTFLTGGAALRLGYNLPSDFGVQIIDSPASVNGGLTHHTPWCFAYAFGGVDGRIVGHDITLDGNSFRGGPSVEKNIFVADLSWGLAFQLFRHVEFTYTRILRTTQFHGQSDKDLFGSATLKAMFFF